jgi:polar amino acid transport system substrate-binding protein
MAVSRPACGVQRMSLAVVVLFLTVVAGLSAQEELVFAASELQPWKIYRGDGVEGVDAVIMRRIAAAMHLRLVCVQAPLARCLMLLEQGRADVVSSVSPDPEREKTLYFLPTKYKGANRKVFYLRAGSGLAIRTYEDLYRVDIGGKLGANYWEPFNSDPRIRLERVSDDASNLMKVAAGRLDCCIVNEITGDYLLKSLALKGALVKAEYFHETAAAGQLAIARS